MLSFFNHIGWDNNGIVVGGIRIGEGGSGWMVATAGALAVVVGSVAYLFNKTRSFPPNVSGPKKITGLLSVMITRTQRVFFTTKMLELCSTYPRLFQLSRFWPIYTVHDVSLVKELLNHPIVINHNSAQNQFYHADRIPTNFSLISIRDDEWKKRRKALAPSFNNTNILNFVEVFQDKANVLQGILTEFAENEQIVDMRQVFSKMTADILGVTVFGVDFDSMRDSTHKLSKAVENFLFVNRVNHFLMLPFWFIFPIKNIRTFLNGLETLINLCRTIVNNRLEMPVKSNDLLQTLVDSGLDLNKAIIPDTLLFLVAGHETTASLLSWAISEIAKHPEVEQKIVEELNTVIGPGKRVTSENVDSLQYLECVINETLRMHPPALVTDRHTRVPVVLDGKQFPGGTLFVVPIWAIHHNETYWPDPFKFDPSRFAPDHQNVPFTFIPFGGGPRICIGWKFSLTEAKVALATIYSRLTITLKEEVKVAETGGLFRPVSVNVIVKKRQFE